MVVDPGGCIPAGWPGPWRAPHPLTRPNRPGPLLLSLARRRASSTSLNFSTGRMGPKGSSATSRVSSAISATMVTGKKYPALFHRLTTGEETGAAGLRLTGDCTDFFELGFVLDRPEVDTLDATIPGFHTAGNRGQALHISS